MTGSTGTEISKEVKQVEFLMTAFIGMLNTLTNEINNTGIGFYLTIVSCPPRIDPLTAVAYKLNNKPTFYLLVSVVNLYCI